MVLTRAALYRKFNMQPQIAARNRLAISWILLVHQEGPGPPFDIYCFGKSKQVSIKPNEKDRFSNKIKVSFHISCSCFSQVVHVLA